VIAQEEGTALESYGSRALVFPGSADYLLTLDRIGPALVELSHGQLSPSAA
jgi:hypothetical protein